MNELIKKIYDMELKKGDGIMIYFKDGKRVPCRVTALHHQEGISYIKVNNEECCVGFEKIKDIRLIVRR